MKMATKVSVIVKCKGDGDKDDCPYINACLPRMIDRTITGCGMPLYMDGMIPKEEIVVEHTVADTSHNAQNAQE